ncbi:MAG: ribosome silencing factor [Chlamydiae bacterium]|nr:ribosome silencing factor [Chlamydiota bacterium]
MDLEKLRLVAQALYDKKGSDILCVDVKAISGLSDYVIIATGNVDKHVKALAREVEDQLRLMKEKPTYSEGYEDGRWIVLDFVGLIVHILLPDTREFYDLEALWKGGKIVDLKIEAK